MYNRWMPPECSTELYHHGIRGMKWGERHGPPYPLSQKAHNAVVKGTSPKTRNTGSATEYSGRKKTDLFWAFKKRGGYKSLKEIMPDLNERLRQEEETRKRLEPIRQKQEKLMAEDKLYKKLADAMDKADNDYLNVAEDDFRPHDAKYKAELQRKSEALDKAKAEFVAYRNKVLPEAAEFGSQKKEKNQYDHSESTIRKVGKWSWLGAKTALDLMSLNPIGLAYDVRDAGTAIVGSAREMRFDSRTKKLATDSKTGLKIKDASKQWSPEEDMKAINPGYISRMSSGTKNNCVLCSLSYDLRRRGYDVAAGNATKGYNYSDLQHWYPGVKGTTVGRFNSDSARKNAMANTFGIESKENRQKYIASSIDAIKKTGEGARGTLFVTWKGSTNGHALAYEVRNGEVHIYDCQNGKKQDPEKLLKQTSDSTAYRLDNLKPDPKYIKEVTRRK